MSRLLSLYRYGPERGYGTRGQLEAREEERRGREGEVERQTARLVTKLFPTDKGRYEV